MCVMLMLNLFVCVDVWCVYLLLNKLWLCVFLGFVFGVGVFVVYVVVDKV